MCDDDEKNITNVDNFSKKPLAYIIFGSTFAKQTNQYKDYVF